MRVAISAILGLVPSLLFAALCDDTYNLQSVTQTLLTGTNAANLSRATKTVSPGFSNLDIVGQSVNYKFIASFAGSCAKQPKAITMRQKAPTAALFSDSIDNSFQIQMFDSNTKVENLKYDYWFGFYKPADALVAYLGRTESESSAFVNFYAIVTYTDSTKNPTSGLWTVSSGYVGPSGPADSASLHTRLLEATKLTTVAQDANRKIHFTVQMLEMRYENKPAPNSIAAAKRPVSGFHASQSGNLVLIQTGDKAANTGEPLSLYGMMGNKISALHPTGYLYQWNGKTSAGADAPTGVYFVQSGSRILGKFFYSR